MFTKILPIIVASLFIFGMSGISLAMMCGEHSGSQQLGQSHGEHEHGTTEAVKEAASEEPVNVGNKICPVSGEKIKEEETYQVEYEGKIYNLCCKMCVKDFKKDPEKYIKKVEEELKKRADQEKKAMPAPEMPEGMSEGHQHTESHPGHQH